MLSLAEIYTEHKYLRLILKVYSSKELAAGYINGPAEVFLLLLHLILFYRFFYENIWREWDEDDDGDYSYVARHLETRLQLYHDIQGGNLPNDLIKKYRGNVIISNNNNDNNNITITILKGDLHLYEVFDSHKKIIAINAFSIFTLIQNYSST